MSAVTALVLIPVGMGMAWAGTIRNIDAMKYGGAFVCLLGSLALAAIVISVVNKEKDKA